MPGLFSIMREAISRVGRPEAPAPRRMRSTLYCCRVMPRSSTTSESPLRTRSAVATSVTTPSSATDANGRAWWISSRIVPIATQAPTNYLTSQVKGCVAGP